jgi:UDP-glucuronate decarboxylase
MMRFMALPGPRDPGQDGLPAFPGPIKIGNPGEFTIKELAELVVKLTGSRSKLVYQPLPQDDPMRRRPDISRAQQYLQGWQPTVVLEEGLKSTIAYFDALLRMTSGR